MPRMTFVERIGFLGPSGRILVGLGAGGALVALIMRREEILTGAAVSLGLGLAMIFFREAFRPRLKPQPDAEGAPTKPWIQWMSSAAIVIATVLGMVFKGTLFYVALAIIVASIIVAFVLSMVTRHQA